MIIKCPHPSYDSTQQFLKFIQPVSSGLYNFYIVIDILFCMIISNCFHTSYYWTHWFLKIIQRPQIGFYIR